MTPGHSDFISRARARVTINTRKNNSIGMSSSIDGHDESESQALRSRVHRASVIDSIKIDRPSLASVLRYGYF